VRGRLSLENALSDVADEMGCGSPGVIRQRLKAPHGIDASDRFVRGQPSAGRRAQRRAAMVSAQLPECFYTTLQLGKGLLGGRFGCKEFFLWVERSLQLVAERDRGSMRRGR
jgi:hypothetical protein